MLKSQNLYKKAKAIIPGGTQLLSKRPEMFLPGHWPSYYEKAKGCEVWDIDGNKYVDMSYMGVGTNILGYADEDVNTKVHDIVDKSNVSTLNAPEEVELAELLCQLHPWAGNVRYAKTGGEAMTIAVRIARASAKKDKVLFCGYHGWHDWYLSANLSEDEALDGHLLSGLKPLGVPRYLKGSSFPFTYNDTEGFLSLIKEHKDEVGVVVLESVRNILPKKEFLETIKQVTQELNIVLVVDEVSAGWRLNLGGAHLLFDLDPDIAVFGKAISNGYPMAVIIGKGKFMQVVQDSFISSTYWTDRIGLVASLATIRKMEEYNVQAHLTNIGEKIQDGWNTIASKHDIRIHVSGIYPLGHFSFEYNNSLAMKTLFTQYMLDEGFLATTAFYASFAHKQEHIEKYLSAIDKTFHRMSKILSTGKIEDYLKGDICHSGFKRLT